MKRKIVTIVSIYVIVMLLVLTIITIISEDKNPPDITFANKSLTYAEGGDDSVLLSDVKAIDKKDGDVTDSLIIESIKILTGGDKVSVSYVARDKNNNIAKKIRIVGCSTEAASSDTTDGMPKITLKTDKVMIVAGADFNPMDYIDEATDDKDNVWRRVRVDGDYNVNTPGKYTLSYYVVDTEGNQSNTVTLNLIVD